MKLGPPARASALPLAALIASGAYSYFRSKGAARNFEEGPRYLQLGPAPTGAR